MLFFNKTKRADFASCSSCACYHPTSGQQCKENRRLSLISRHQPQSKTDRNCITVAVTRLQEDDPYIHALKQLEHPEHLFNASSPAHHCEQCVKHAEWQGHAGPKGQTMEREEDSVTGEHSRRSLGCLPFSRCCHGLVSDCVAPNPSFSFCWFLTASKGICHQSVGRTMCSYTSTTITRNSHSRRAKQTLISELIAI